MIFNSSQRHLAHYLNLAVFLDKQESIQSIEDRRMIDISLTSKKKKEIRKLLSKFVFPFQKEKQMKHIELSSEIRNINNHGKYTFWIKPISWKYSCNKEYFKFFALLDIPHHSVYRRYRLDPTLLPSSTVEKG